MTIGNDDGPPGVISISPTEIQYLKDRDFGDGEQSHQAIGGYSRESIDGFSRFRNAYAAEVLEHQYHLSSTAFSELSPECIAVTEKRVRLALGPVAANGALAGVMDCCSVGAAPEDLVEGVPGRLVAVVDLKEGISGEKRAEWTTSILGIPIFYRAKAGDIS